MALLFSKHTSGALLPTAPEAPIIISISRRCLFDIGLNKWKRSILIIASTAFSRLFLVFEMAYFSCYITG